MKPPFAHWRSRRRLRREVEANGARGEYTVEIVVWDGAGNRFGGRGSVEPDKLGRVLGEMAGAAASFCEGAGHLECEQRERLSFTRPKPPLDRTQAPIDYEGRTPP